MSRRTIEAGDRVRPERLVAALDPARGKRRLSVQELLSASGVH